MSERKLYAMVSGQGTACYEACLCSECDNPQNRAAIEAYTTVSSNHMSEIDRPMPGSWTDCTDNDALTCNTCGWYAP